MQEAPHERSRRRAALREHVDAPDFNDYRRHADGLCPAAVLGDRVGIVHYYVGE